MRQSIFKKKLAIQSDEFTFIADLKVWGRWGMHRETWIKNQDLQWRNENYLVIYDIGNKCSVIWCKLFRLRSQSFCSFSSSFVCSTDKFFFNCSIKLRADNPNLKSNWCICLMPMKLHFCSSLGLIAFDYILGEFQCIYTFGY